MIQRIKELLHLLSTELQRPLCIYQLCQTLLAVVCTNNTIDCNCRLHEFDDVIACLTELSAISSNTPMECSQFACNARLLRTMNYIR